MLNCHCYIAILETIQLCVKKKKKRAQDRFRMLSTKCIYKSYCGGACGAGGARGVMVIIIENGHGDMSSNSGHNIAFHMALRPL